MRAGHQLGVGIEGCSSGIVWGGGKVRSFLSAGEHTHLSNIRWGIGCWGITVDASELQKEQSVHPHGNMLELVYYSS